MLIPKISQANQIFIFMATLPNAFVEVAKNSEHFIIRSISSDVKFNWTVTL